MNLYSTKSKKNVNKKYDVLDSDTKFVISFGDSRFQDYTIHKDSDIKTNCVSRHKTNENWGLTGIRSAVFYSRWILWNKTTLQYSIRDVNKRSNINTKLI